MPRNQKYRFDFMTIIGVSLLILIILVSAFAPYIAHFDPSLMQPRLRLSSPNEEFWFGTDALGRDLFSRVLYGSRTSLLIGFLVALGTTLIGTIIGLLAGSWRLLDKILMRFMDGVMAIPGVLLAIALVAIFGANLYSIVFAISLPEIPRMVRLVRSVVLSLREELYVQAAIGLGIPKYKVVLRHILPNCLAPLIVQASYVFAAAILLEAVLGFLGVGFPPQTPTFGNILAEGRPVFQRAPWITIIPGVFLAITVLAVNILGDQLRDKFDPRMAEGSVG